MGKILFDEETQDHLVDYRRTTAPARPEEDRLAAARKKAEELKAKRGAKPAAEVDKTNKEAEAEDRTAPRIPKTSPTGREIMPGRYEKLKKDGTPSRQGERDRSEILRNARRATFYMDPETLRDLKTVARKQGIGLSEAVNIACRQYLKKTGGGK